MSPIQSTTPVNMGNTYEAVAGTMGEERVPVGQGGGWKRQPIWDMAAGVLLFYSTLLTRIGAAPKYKNSAIYERGTTIQEQLICGWEHFDCTAMTRGTRRTLHMERECSV